MLHIGALWVEHARVRASRTSSPDAVVGVDRPVAVARVLHSSLSWRGVQETQGEQRTKKFAQAAVDQEVSDLHSKLDLLLVLGSCQAHTDCCGSQGF